MPVSTTFIVEVLLECTTSTFVAKSQVLVVSDFTGDATVYRISASRSSASETSDATLYIEEQAAQLLRTESARVKTSAFDYHLALLLLDKSPDVTAKNHSLLDQIHTKW